MLPVIALVGRPNVGKSTLFNVLTRTRDALVADFPGLTRDRQYGRGRWGDLPFLVMDSGGLSGDDVAIDQMVADQVWDSLAQCDVILFLVDGRADLTEIDHNIATRLRRMGKTTQIVVNKAEGRDEELIIADFFSLGLGMPIAISASHQRGIHELVESIHALLPPVDEPESVLDDEDDPEKPIRLAVVGRPNVGKSTLINRLLGEERVLACDMPGTTRDSIEIPFERDGQAYILIDTAGVRRRSRVDDMIEKFSVIKTLQSVERANVVVFVLDAQQEISDQDAHLLGLVLDSGRALVLAVNKWDHLSSDARERIRTEITRKLQFVDFTKPMFISALHGSGVMDVLEQAQRAYRSATQKMSTAELTRILEMALHQHQPPLVKGFAIKLRYAHQGGRNPPRIIIHGNRVQHVKESYRRYLINTFRRELKIYGTPIRIEFKSNENPYQPTT